MGPYLMAMILVCICDACLKTTVGTGGSRNRGIAFGLLKRTPARVVLLHGITIMGVGIGAYVTGREYLWAVVIGGLANLGDRVVGGAVTDYIEVRVGAHRFPSFNLADVVVVVNIALWCTATMST